MGYVLCQDQLRVVVVTGTERRSTNDKTGAMLQVWILDVRHDPLQTVRMGLDSSICGDCVHRGALGKRSCYVRLDTAPLGVWRAWKRGRYPYLPKSRYADVFSGRVVRWGAYGDPAFIPLDIVRWVSFFAAGWTGYTHQWRGPEVQAFREYVMASVDTEAERISANGAGWRTFRVRSEQDAHMPGEITCPASNEAGHRTTCARCGLCDGKRVATDARKDINIVVHGIGKRNFRSAPASEGLIQIQIGKGQM